MTSDAYRCNVPVLICGFIRPEALSRVVDAARQAGVMTLYLALDAPREGRESDLVGYEACKEIFEHIDWPCSVNRDYATHNMGCGNRMTSAISWVLSHEEQVIILEDDCVPGVDFFRFCEELLDKYKDDSRVGMIAGSDEHLHLSKIKTYGDSYYFDRMSTIWGWATWRRAWKLHDSDMTIYPFMAQSGILKNIFKKDRFVREWRWKAKRIYDKKLKTWAGAWAVTMYKEHMLAIHPFRNLVTNIGDGKSSRSEMCASRTAFRTPFEGRPIESIEFPLRHPKTMIPNGLCEKYCLEDSLYVHPIRKILRDPRTALTRLISLMKG